MRSTSRLLFLASLLAACSSEPTDAPWTRVSRTELELAQERQLELATTARGELFGELVAALTGEMERSGPVTAMEVCSVKAPSIAQATSKRLGLTIGRTSFKLRNPENAPPTWARELLESRPQEDVLLEGPDGQLGVTFPIRVAAKCLACHGPLEELAPDVRAAIAELYPEDEATGFAEDDLRGWFWVEVPAL